MYNYLEQIFNNTKDIILKDFDVVEQQEVIDGYKKYLDVHYKETFDEIDEKEEAVKIFSDVEKNNWINSKKDEKQRLLIEDKVLDKVRNLSALAQKYAVNRLECELNNQEYVSTISEDDVNNYINQMEELVELVRPFNVNIAKELLSEASVDFMYGANLTNNTSLRVGRMR